MLRAGGPNGRRPLCLLLWFLYPGSNCHGVEGPQRMKLENLNENWH